MQQGVIRNRIQFFVLGMLSGVSLGSAVVLLATQYVEHGDVLYPARIRMSRKGKRVNFELLLQ